jgi:hypothetical protein
VTVAEALRLTSVSAEARRSPLDLRAPVGENDISSAPTAWRTAHDEWREMTLGVGIRTGYVVATSCD